MLIAKESRPVEETGPGLSCAKMQFAESVWEARAGETASWIFKYPQSDKRNDLESRVTKVVSQQDEKLVHDSAWLESEVSRRPKRKKKSFACLRAYDQPW
jgi:hypothetical protein